MNAAELQDKEVATVHLRPKALPIGYARRESLDIADQLRTDNGWTLSDLAEEMDCYTEYSFLRSILR